MNPTSKKHYSAVIGLNLLGYNFCDDEEPLMCDDCMAMMDEQIVEYLGVYFLYDNEMVLGIVLRAPERFKLREI